MSAVVREASDASSSAAVATSVFRFVPEHQRARFEALFREERHDFGDLVLRQGDPADAFFVMVSGRARVVKTGHDGEELALGMLRAGDEFGESALLTGGVRTASVRCSSAVVVRRLDRESFEALVAEAPEFRDYLELTARYRVLHGFLHEFSNLGRLPPPALRRLIGKLEPREVRRGECIVREGEPPGPMYVLREGRVRIYTGQGARAVNRAFLREGEFFGERSILDQSPRGATAEAVTDCRLLVLAAETVAELRDEVPEFARLLEERRAQYRVDREARMPLDFVPAEALPAEATVALAPGSADEPGPTEAPAGPEAAEDDADAPFSDERGLFRKRAGRIRRFEVLRQIDEMDCGAASLGMVCRHFGRKVSLARIRQLCHTSHDGTSLKALVHAATELGLAARAVKVSLRNLPKMPVPAIVHWEGNHWIVLLDVGKQYVRVADPATGTRRRLKRAEFEAKWTGYAALFDYTTDFDSAPEGRGTLAWIRPFFQRHWRALLQAFLLAGIASGLQLLFPMFTQVVVDTVLVERDHGLLHVTIAGMVAAGIFAMLAGVLGRYLLSHVAVQIDAAMLDFLVRQLLALPMSYFHARRTGDILRRLAGARELREFVVHHGIGALLAVVQAASAVALMAVYSGRLLMVFLLTLPVYLLMMVFSTKVLRPLFGDLEESEGRYSSQQIDAIRGIEAVKSAGAESAFRDGMLEEFLRVSRKRFRSNFILLSYGSALQTISLLSTAAFLLVGAGMVIEGQLTFGTFMAFNALLGMAYSGVTTVIDVWDDGQMMVVLMNRMSDIFEQEPEQGRDRSRLRPVATLEGRIELRGVGFRYGGAEAPPILQELDLEIPPGKTVAIVGRSGSGKTTLIKLLAGVLEPTEGTILFDHLDLKTLNYRDVRRQIGMVLQENHLFNETILENIAFGDPEPDLARAMRAARLASADDFISRLPLGYETRIGDSGLALSGGQKQRICIARALYHDPPLLIFDEATSALDTESERAIQDNLGRLMKGRTCLVIAHRLSTIRDADRIVVLERGRIAETGSHDELMARRGLYFYLASQQCGLS